MKLCVVVAFHRPAGYCWFPPWGHYQELFEECLSSAVARGDLYPRDSCRVLRSEEGGRAVSMRRVHRWRPQQGLEFVHRRAQADAPGRGAACKERREAHHTQLGELTGRRPCWDEHSVSLERPL